MDMHCPRHPHTTWLYGEVPENEADTSYPYVAVCQHCVFSLVAEPTAYRVATLPTATALGDLPAQSLTEDTSHGPHHLGIG